MLGKPVKRPARIDRRLVRELKALSDTDDPYDTITGTTMCASDFYEGNLCQLTSRKLTFCNCRTRSFRWCFLRVHRNRQNGILGKIAQSRRNKYRNGSITFRCFNSFSRHQIGSSLCSSIG